MWNAAHTAWRVCRGVVAASLTWLWVALGVVGRGRETPSRLTVALFVVLTLLVVALIARRLRFRPPSLRAQRLSRWLAAAPALADVEVGLGMVAGVYAALAMTGGIGSVLFPVVYGVVAFAVTFLSRAGALTVVLSSVVMELVFAARSGGTEHSSLVVVHLVFLLVAAGSHFLFLRGLVAHQRRKNDAKLRLEIAKVHESARDYRLISAALGVESRPSRPRTAEEEELAAGSVQTISSSISYTLDLLKSALEVRTVVLLWLDDRAQYLKVKEIVTDSFAISEKNRVPISGALRAVVRDRRPVSIEKTRPGQVAYYEGDEPLGAFLGAPILDGAHLRGVLCVDRAAAFDDRDAMLLVGAARQIVHVVRSERVFASVERSKYEHERFYRASAMLGQALTLDQVMETAFDAAGLIIGYDAAAITLYESRERRHRVGGVRINPTAAPMINAEALSRLEFGDTASLVSMVVKNRHCLPASGQLRDVTTPVFGGPVQFRGVESLIVLPLLSADEAIGTFTLASRTKGNFRRDVREMLGVISTQIAISLQNALMYKEMETMATTDGLTGLTNHRTFQERFGQVIERAERHGYRAAMLLCDVDHFKAVNDTHGHPVGDEVLKKVAAVLVDAVRKIDVTARYGGEEFAVVLEGPDLVGAIGLAERIREDVSQMRFESEAGPFQVTMSIGVAMFPDDSRQQAELIERADQALYCAKSSGRNRVVTYPDYVAARNARRVG